MESAPIQNVLRRCREGKKPGFPRLRAKSRFRSAMFRVADRPFIKDECIRIIGVAGAIKVSLASTAPQQVRRKRAPLLAKRHKHIADWRRDHAHKLSRQIINRFGRIAAEDLNVKGLAAGMHAKHVTHAA